MATWPEYLLPNPEDHCSDLQRSFKSQAYKNGSSRVIQSSGIHRTRWKEIAKLCFERPNLRTYGREQPRKIHGAMLWPLHAHTHTCTCTYIFVNKHMRSCMPANRVHMQKFALFLSIFPIFGAFQSWQRWARQSAGLSGWTPGRHMAMSVMAFCLPHPREEEVCDGCDGETQTSQ